MSLCDPWGSVSIHRLIKSERIETSRMFKDEFIHGMGFCIHSQLTESNRLTCLVILCSTWFFFYPSPKFKPNRQRNQIVEIIDYPLAEDSVPMFGDEFVRHMGFCTHPGATVDVFDANGDDYADMTCHDSKGRIQIAEGHIVNHLNPNHAANLGN